MGADLRVILCPFHNDTRPSMRLYGKFSHCFSCGAHVLTEELDLPEHAKIIPKKEPTNITGMIRYIETLPKKDIRGFKLHTDDLGYYIIWPEKNYYKRRNFSGNARYTAPSGVKPPLFVYGGSSKHLVIVEGELNCMSAYKATWGDYKLVSPGPASDMMRHIKVYSYYHKITIITDYDAAGIVFGCQLKEHLLKMNKHAKLVTIRQDYSQILQDRGEEAVREQFERDML